MRNVASPHSLARPWGLTIALLMASFVTLVGVARGLDPDVILLRAAAAAVVLGVGTRIVVRFCQTLVEKQR